MTSSVFTKFCNHQHELVPEHSKQPRPHQPSRPPTPGPQVPPSRLGRSPVWPCHTGGLTHPVWPPVSGSLRTVGSGPRVGASLRLVAEGRSARGGPAVRVRASAHARLGSFRFLAIRSAAAAIAGGPAFAWPRGQFSAVRGPPRRDASRARRGRGGGPRVLMPAPPSGAHEDAGAALGPRSAP